MKILFLTVGPDIIPSSRTRVYQFLPYLHKGGIKTKAISCTSKTNAYKIANAIKRGVLDKIFGKIFAFFNILRFLLLTKRFDILFIQKVLLPQSLVNVVKMLNDNIIFDFDDAVFLSDGYQYNPNGKLLERFNYILRNSKNIIVSNYFLREKAAILNKKVHVLTTPVDTNRFFPKAKDMKAKNNIVIGWIGSPASSRYLRDIKDVFNVLVKKYNNLKFEFIGADHFYEERDNFNIKKWNLYSEVNDLQNFDIGIMPLKNDEWCRGKGGYKLLQYMAVGIPSVASPVGINKELIEEGASGFLVDSPQEWIEKISRLIEDQDLRKIMGRRARETVETLYSYEVAAPKFLRTFEDILGSPKSGH